MLTRYSGLNHHISPCEPSDKGKYDIPLVTNSIGRKIVAVFPRAAFLALPVNSSNLPGSPKPNMELFFLGDDAGAAEDLLAPFFFLEADAGTQVELLLSLSSSLSLSKLSSFSSLEDFTLSLAEPLLSPSLLELSFSPNDQDREKIPFTYEVRVEYRRT